MNRPAISVLCGVVALLLAGSASAADCLPKVHGGWIRLSPGSMQMMLAGFGRIENHCAMPATVTAAHSAAFADVSLHRTSVVDGISRMRAIAQLPIAANGVGVFEPGALHLMLMQPAGPLKAGDHVRIDFRLQDGRDFHGDFVVRPFGG
jgi:copper(I)-binding protein